MILDTSFIIDVLRGSQNAVKKLEKLANTNIAVTTPSIVELFSGLAQCSNTQKELEKIKDILGEQVCLPLDAGSAVQAGLVHGFLIRDSQEIGEVDAMIAGIALQNQIPVLTRNVKHFSRVRGLKVETY